MKRKFSECLHPAQRSLLMAHAVTASMSAMEDMAKAFHIAQDIPKDLKIVPPAKPGQLKQYFAEELIEAFVSSLEFCQDWSDSVNEFRDLLNDRVSREEHEEFLETYVEGVKEDGKTEGA